MTVILLVCCNIGNEEKRNVCHLYFFSFTEVGLNLTSIDLVDRYHADAYGILLPAQATTKIFVVNRRRRIGLHRFEWPAVRFSHPLFQSCQLWLRANSRLILKPLSSLNMSIETVLSMPLNQTTFPMAFR